LILNNFSEDNNLASDLIMTFIETSVCGIPEYYIPVVYWCAVSFFALVVSFCMLMRADLLNEEKNTHFFGGDMLRLEDTMDGFHENSLSLEVAIGTLVDASQKHHILTPDKKVEILKRIIHGFCYTELGDRHKSSDAIIDAIHEEVMLLMKQRKIEAENAKRKAQRLKKQNEIQA